LRSRRLRPIIANVGRTYRAFLLDADNTLFDYDRSEGEALLETLASFGGASPEAGSALQTYRRINAGLWRSLEEGRVTLAELKVERFRALGEALHLDADPQALSQEYLGRLSEKAHFMPHAREVLEKLSAVSPLCLVTNGISRVQRGRIERAGIGGMFRLVLISEEIGLSKPDPRFFEAALSGLGAKAADALCVGDSLSSDIRGARGARIAACWFNPGGAPLPEGAEAPDHVVRDLRELLPMAAAPAGG
jgi:YjjG family noncanonical pyrimidine nucleotidase